MGQRLINLSPFPLCTHLSTTSAGSPAGQQQRRRAQQQCCQVPSLHSLAAAALVAHIDRVASLRGLPEELVLLLFEAVLAQGRLTPRVLGLFEDTRHELLAARVSQLGISSWT